MKVAGSRRAITDHGNMCSRVQFHAEAVMHGIADHLRDVRRAEEPVRRKGRIDDYEAGGT